MNKKHEWIDIGTRIEHEIPVWPGDPKVEIARVATIEKEGYNLTSFSMSAHTGTHIDAPLHYIADGASIDQVEITRLIGPAKVIEIKDRVITAESLAPFDIEPGDRILLKTQNSLNEWQKQLFKKDYAYLDESAARFLAGKRIALTGIDYLSIGSFHSGEETHRILLLENILVVEGLLLQDIQAGDYEMICLPLKIKSADGAPARVLLRKINQQNFFTHD